MECLSVIADNNQIHDKDTQRILLKPYERNDLGMLSENSTCITFGRTTI